MRGKCYTCDVSDSVRRSSADDAQVEPGTKQVLSAVIVAFNNSERDLKRLVMQVRAAAAAADIKCEVIVVANDQKTYSSVESDKTIVQDNVGFAAAVNRGTREALGSTMLYINPDCQIDPHALSAFLKIHVGSDRNWVVGPLLVDDRGQLDGRAYANWTFTPMRIWNSRRAVRSLQSHYHAPFRVPGHMKMPGAFIAMEQETARRLGPFDDRFFLYAEDRDLTDRCRKAGIPVIIDPRTKVKHAGQGSSNMETRSGYVARSQIDGNLRIAFRRYGRRGLLFAMADEIGRGAIHSLRSRSSTKLRIAYEVFRKWMIYPSVEADRVF